MRTIDPKTTSREGAAVYPDQPKDPLTHLQQGRLSELHAMAESTYRGCPEFWANLAQDAEALASLSPKIYLLAARLWERASWATIGHNRAEGYDVAYERCMAAISTA